MNGKEKCRALKEIRKQIAERNDIEFAVSECTHKGDCKGTCPKCEEELRYLERQLKLRKSIGKAVAIVGISTGVCTTMTACTPFEAIHDFIMNLTPEQQLDGEVAPPRMEGVMELPRNTDEPLSGDIALEEPTY